MLPHPHARQSGLRHVIVLFVRRCIAAAGFVSFAGDLSLLFPVDIRNAHVYVKAAEAVEARDMMQAEELLGGAGLWAAAAQMHRVYGSQDDFARVASAHAPQLLKPDAKQQHRSSEQRNSVSQPDRTNIPTGTNSDAHDTDSSSHAVRPPPSCYRFSITALSRSLWSLTSAILHSRQACILTSPHVHLTRECLQFFVVHRVVVFGSRCWDSP